MFHKHHHYGIRDLSNNGFSSYFSNKNQFVSINGFNSTTQSLRYGVPQGSVVGFLLFLIYINVLHNAMKFSQLLHFADETCLLNIQSKSSVINSSISSKSGNKDLKELSFWLNANKIHLMLQKQRLY